MAMIYVGARLAGRAILPMAAVLLTSTSLLLFNPTLIGDVSFQLTMLITAALVRWVPPVSASIPGPRWLAAAVAVPVIAQISASPIVAYHFQSAVPWAAIANLLVPWLLGPVVLLSVAATSLALAWTAGAGVLLDVVAVGESLLWWASTPGRAVELVPPAPGTVLLILFGAIGLLALTSGRGARIGAATWVVLLAGHATWWLVLPITQRTEVELLEVSEGLACRVSTPSSHLLVDGGNLQREAAVGLASARVRALDAAVVSHGDEDHLRGMLTVLRTIRTDCLILPAWLASSSDSVPLLRVARHRGTRVAPVTRGTAMNLKGAILEVLWPGVGDLPRAENERSLVARIRLDASTVLITSDIGESTERELVESVALNCDLLVVPHHGSRRSSTAPFLDAANPTIALIPAGPENRHNHPPPDVLTRLEKRSIPFRMPKRDGRCGARWEEREWVLYP
jgi:competence protein ComEC